MTASASTSSTEPSARVASMLCGGFSLPRPSMIVTPAASSDSRMSWDWLRASSRSRELTVEKSAQASVVYESPSSWPKRTPNAVEALTRRIASAVAMSVFDGTTSVSTAEPPTPFSSTMVTSAPAWAATSAAS